VISLKPSLITYMPDSPVSGFPIAIPFCKTLSLQRKPSTEVQMTRECSYLKEALEDSSFLQRSQSIKLSVTHCQIDMKQMLFLFGIWTQSCQCLVTVVVHITLTKSW